MSNNKQQSLGKAENGVLQSREAAGKSFNSGAVQVSTKSRANVTITRKDMGALGLPEGQLQAYAARMKQEADSTHRAPQAAPHSSP